MNKPKGEKNNDLGVVRFAVVGNPVSHSKSPLIHDLFAKQTGKLLQYSKQQLEESAFDSYVRNFFADGGGGLNVTVPFKGKAYKIADSCSRRAQLAQAVNTLYLDSNAVLCGENTDGAGIIQDICNNHDFAITGKNILFLGAGGAVRGVLAALVEASPGSVTIANRTVAKAEQLQDAFAEVLSVKAYSYENLPATDFDLIINGTSMSLEGKLPPISSAVFASNCCCYDMMYAETDTAFVAWAKQSGVELALDGLGMLVEQAAESFAIWHGVRPDTDAVLRAFRSQ